MTAAETWSSSMDHMEDFLPARDSRNAEIPSHIYEKIGVACPKCGKDVVLKKDAERAENIMDVMDNPECDFMSWQKPSNKKCPVCGSYMVEKGNKLVCSQETCGYVEQKEKEED